MVANFAAVAAAAFFSGTAYAGDTYIGLSRTTPGEAYADFAAARNVENHNSPFAMKLYGGIGLTDRYALEVGYGMFGTWRISDPTPGSTDEFRTSSKLLYVAGRAATPMGDSFSLFGKFGLAANSIEHESSGLLPSSNTSAVRPMLGFGADYKITKHVAGVLEFNYYGAVDENFTQQKLELGLKYSF